MDFSRYIDFADPDGPKLVGHRIWLTHVVYEVLFHHLTAEQLAARFPTLSMETVYACLLYLEQNRDECARQLGEHLDWSRRNREAHADETRELRERLLARKAEAAAEGGA